MKPVVTRDFPIEVTPGAELVDDGVRELVEGIFEVRLNRQFDFTFIPLEPGMIPPFSFAAAAQKEVEAWQTPADARLALFYGSRFVVTPHDPLADHEVRFPSQYGAPIPGTVGHGEPRPPREGVVFYTSTGQYEAITADLERFLQPYESRHYDERALDLQGRPVVDFLVDRLQNSRLVPDDLLYWLGLERTVVA